MTDRTRQWVGIAALATTFGAGAGYGAFQFKFGAFQSELNTFRDQLTRIDQRVADMYCSQVPAEKRAGCR
jgi:hypothetical protein